MQNEHIEVTLKVTSVLEEPVFPNISTLFVSSLQNEFFIDEEMIADSI
jgi:hypothetical protein